MEVVRHDDEAVDEMSYRMIFENFGEDDFSNFLILEEAFAFALIEPCFDFECEQAVVLSFCFFRPWLWIFCQPEFAVNIPFCE